MGRSGAGGAHAVGCGVRSTLCGLAAGQLLLACRVPCAGRPHVAPPWRTGGRRPPLVYRAAFWFSLCAKLWCAWLRVSVLASAAVLARSWLLGGACGLRFRK